MQKRQQNREAIKLRNRAYYNKKKNSDLKYTPSNKSCTQNTYPINLNEHSENANHNSNTHNENEILARTVPQTDNEIFSEIHPNSKVGETIVKFELGELKHTLKSCNICLETQPFFHESFENPHHHLPSIDNVIIDKNGVCRKCANDNKKRKKCRSRAAKWSGYLSPEACLGPIEDQIRDNNMHFYKIPDQLKNLTTVELALISKITVCIRVHMLRHSMLASKGHSVSIPQRMSIATQLPKLPHQVGIVILKRKGKNDKCKHYTVQRHTVQRALECLCFGVPNGGLEHQLPNTKLYKGPNHKNKILKGKYFEHFPNPYYTDVDIVLDRLSELPTEREEYHGLLTVYTEKDITEKDKGPAPEQFEIPYSPTDESYTTSGITLPAEPKILVKK